MTAMHPLHAAVGTSPADAEGCRKSAGFWREASVFSAFFSVPFNDCEHGNGNGERERRAW